MKRSHTGACWLLLSSLVSLGGLTASAAAPTVVGHRAEGSSTDTIGNDGAWINASLAEAAADLVATRVFAKVAAVPGEYKAAIYAVVGGRLLAQSQAARAAADGWLELPLVTPAKLAAGGRYWLAIWSDDAAAKVYCDQGGATRWVRRNFGDWPDPLELTAGSAVTYCLYAAGETLPPADAAPPAKPSERVLAGHAVKLDAGGRLIPWDAPAAKAYDQFLRRRWQFIKTKVPSAPGPAPRSDYPQYYFYDGFRTKDPVITPDNWMNDVGEKIPNWFESARLYYAYTGDAAPLAIVRRLIDYSLDHGTSPAEFAWPGFPYTTTNYGDIEFRGFHGPFALHETHTDHAADMGLAYYRLYQLTGGDRYLRAALAVADALVAHVRTGSETESVWPYRVRMDTGQITAQYCANWAGAVGLLDALVVAGQGNTAAYAAARDKAREFVLRCPMVNGRWVDGHSDNPVTGNGNRSNMSKSNTMLYLFDHPEFDPDWRRDIPRYLKWTEDLFVTRTSDGEPATAFGANVVGEQDSFNYKMDYQTARYAAECARWYRASGDETYREKAYRSLNWVTYCSDAEGRATESPYSPHIAPWWSDCYGECPRMFYHVFAAMPEWAPPGEDHILYSAGVLADVAYAPGEVRYTPRDATGVEYLRLSFLPTTVTVDGLPLARAATDGWEARELGGGDFAVTVRHRRPGAVRLAGVRRAAALVSVNPGQVFQTIDGCGVNANHRSWRGDELKPVLDAFIDQAGMTLFRVVFDNTDWEPTDATYASPRFEPFWQMLAYLGQRGVGATSFPCFMGPGPARLGGRALAPGQEAEWAKMITFLLAYARDHRGLNITLLAPDNEPDIVNEGISIKDGRR